MPSYNMFTTMREMVKRADKMSGNEPLYPTVEDYYAATLRQLGTLPGHPLEKKATFNQILAEMLWDRSERPYYSIHPQLVTKLCQVDFSKVPSNLITMPDPYDLICIRLNQENELLTIEKGKYYLRSMLVWKRRAGQIIKLKDEIFEIRDEVLICWIDFGEKSDLPYKESPLHTYKCFPIKDGEMVEDVFDEYPSSPYAELGVHVPREFAENCVKLFISVGFLAASETPLLAFDILNKDVHKWLRANDDERKIMVDRAKRRGHNGWMLGTDQMFTSRELQYSHIRAGHPHLYWHGKGKTKLKMRFVAPTTVRKDKPIKKDKSK